MFSLQVDQNVTAAQMLIFRYKSTIVQFPNNSSFYWSHKSTVANFRCALLAMLSDLQTYLNILLIPHHSSVYVI
jgi:hypothetical protein